MRGWLLVVAALVTSVSGIDLFSRRLLSYALLSQFSQRKVIVLPIVIPLGLGRNLFRRGPWEERSNKGTEIFIHAGSGLETLGQHASQRHHFNCVLKDCQDTSVLNIW